MDSENVSNSNSERRRFPRAEFPCKIVIGSPIRLLISHTENISEGGIRVIVEEKLATYTNVGIEMFFEKERAIKCKGKVMWVLEKVNPVNQKVTMYDIGIQFTDISNPDRECIRQMVGKLAP